MASETESMYSLSHVNSDSHGASIHDGTMIWWYSDNKEQDSDTEANQ